MFIKYKIQIFFSVGGEITLLETLEGSQSCLPQRGHKMVENQGPGRNEGNLLGMRKSVVCALTFNHPNTLIGVRFA